MYMKPAAITKGPPAASQRSTSLLVIGFFRQRAVLSIYLSGATEGPNVSRRAWQGHGARNAECRLILREVLRWTRLDEDICVEGLVARGRSGEMPGSLPSAWVVSTLIPARNVVVLK